LRDIISKYQKTLFVVTHIINFPKDYVAVWEVHHLDDYIQLIACLH
jgi:hypothetical protein